MYDEEEPFEEDIFSDWEEEKQTFLFPVGSQLKKSYDKEILTVIGYVIYNGDIFHILLDEYMEEIDVYIDKDTSFKIVGVA